MAIRVLMFDPLEQSEVEQFEKDLDFYLQDGWVVLTAIAGNRYGIDGNTRSYRTSNVMSPNYRDYVVFVLRNAEFEQSELEKEAVIRRSQ